MPDALTQLTVLIQQGRSAKEDEIKPLVEALFGQRYHKAAWKDLQVRNAYGLAREDVDGGVPYAGLIHPDNPTSGPYGGTSLVWFPGDGCSLMGLGIGTRGISPDEGILTRPGHRRRIAALRRLFARHGVKGWAKPDPAALGIEVPEVVRGWWPEFAPAFKRYGSEMYCFAKVPGEPNAGRGVVQAFFDLYAYERRWKTLAAAQQESDELLGALRSDLFQVPTPKLVHDLLLKRRFVILQGPPGTGKTRMADLVRREFFKGRGKTIQFHPSVTYEDFIVGLAPDPTKGELHFQVRAGALLSAATQATAEPYLLVIDEVNRADLGKVLGEAIYLFEADEVGGQNAREVELPHSFNGKRTLRIPENLYVLATMNTADRSIAAVDLAIRRRFAFVAVPPNRSAVVEQGLESAVQCFDRLADVFVEHASDEALALMPGHAYFLAGDEASLRRRMTFEVIPLLDDYLRQGLLGSAAAELQAVRDSLADQYSVDASS
ncbi:MAG TPA: AAA family ATPase [Gemmatimonadales bacterium]|jgi:5-methylcytosine-specific restriction protein B|nr:AAA family ATPase [Gemmatimonadales bacterium]